MTQVCGLEATIEGMKGTSQRRLTISKPVSPNVVFVCKADQVSPNVVCKSIVLLKQRSG